MGLAELILGKSNPFAEFVAQNKNTIHNAGAGFAQGTNFGSGLAAAAQGAAAGAPVDDAYAIQQKAEQARLDGIAKTAAWLKQNYPQFSQLPPEQGFEIASKLATARATQTAQADPADVATYKFYANQEIAAKRTPKSFADWTAGTRPGIKGSLGDPLSFVDPVTKQIHPVQKFTDGSTIDLTTQQPPASNLVYDPYSTAAAKTGGQVDATTAAAARAALPGAEQAYMTTKKALGQLSSDSSVMQGQAENFSKFAGLIPEQMLPILPQTNRANFQTVIDQLSGGAFLNIRQALKGAGQVTDFEGQKGEDAISQMKRAAERGDNAAFNSAVRDFNAALDRGMDLLRKTAAGDYAAGNVPGLQDGIAQGGGKILTYNPATGELE